MADELERDQVRVWLDTVFRPLDEGLAGEIEWLETRKSPSYRQASKSLERISTTHEHIGARHRRNLEQVRRWSAELRTASDVHDQAARVLRAACEEAHAALLADERVLAATRSVAENERAYLVEYLVNGVEELPSHYGLRDVWSQVRPGLLQAREPHRERVATIARLVSDVLEAALRLRSVVDRLFDSVADEYKLPPVAQAS